MVISQGLERNFGTLHAPAHSYPFSRPLTTRVSSGPLQVRRISLTGAELTGGLQQAPPLKPTFHTCRSCAFPRSSAAMGPCSRTGYSFPPFARSPSSVFITCSVVFGAVFRPDPDQLPLHPRHRASIWGKTPSSRFYLVVGPSFQRNAIGSVHVSRKLLLSYQRVCMIGKSTRRNRSTIPRALLERCFPAGNQWTRCSSILHTHRASTT